MGQGPLSCITHSNILV